MEFTLSRHARYELERRSIAIELVQLVLEEPDQIVPGFGSLRVYQSRI